LTWHKIIFGDCRNMSEIPDGSFPIEKSIKGILKDTVCGKARGSLNYCSHEKGHHYIYLDSKLFLEYYAALEES